MDGVPSAGTQPEASVRAAARAELHEKLLRWFKDAMDSSITARRKSERDRDYYDSIQFTDAEKATLKGRGQAAEAFNRIAPKVDYLLGAERAQRTQPRALPRNMADEAAADAATEALRFVLLNNDFDQVRSQVNENLLIEGSGFGEVTGAQAMNGQIEVKIAEIPWDRFFADPYARRRDFEDARYRGQVIWMDREDALRDWPEFAEILTTSWMEGRDDDTYSDKPPLWVDTGRNRIRIVEMWYREGARVFRCVFGRGGILEGPEESPYRDEDGVQEDPYVCTSPKINRDGERYGVVRPLIPIQDEINKRRSKGLHLLSVRQVKLERGAADVDTVRRELAKPDGVIEVQSGFEFDILNTNDMAQAQFHLLEEAKSEIDNIGASAALQGRGNDGETGRALQVRQQGGQMELGPVFDALRSWQQRVYRKAWNRIHQFWTSERAVRVTDNPESPKWIVLNKPVTLGEELAAQFGGQLPPEYAMDPRMGAVVRRENDLAQLDVDIIIGDAPDYATLRQEQFEMLAALVKAGVRGRELEALIKLSGVPEVEEVLKLLKGTPEEQQQRAQQEQQQMRIAIEDAISKIRERDAKTDKALEEAEKAGANADYFRAQVEKILAEIEGRLPRTVAG